MEMKDKIEKAFFYMVEQKDKGIKFISPTEIGQIFGGRHSSFGSPICKRMVELGLAERNSRGQYRIL